MITYDEVLNMNYYKKTSYTGWAGGMRFLIKREQPSLPEDAPEDTPAPAPIFHVWAWPGPFIFELTPVEKKYTAQFPFTEEGRHQVVDWLNEQFETHKTDWPKEKIDNWE